VSVALLFSPQGSQAVGMGRDLARRWRAAADCYETADRVLGWSVASTCWDGPEARLNDTRQTQPCLVTTSLAALAALRSETELRPAFVAGHSVGEYAALVAAGVLGVDDGLRLVGRRGELMADAAVAGGMSAVIGLDRDEVARAVATLQLGDDLVVANDNAPGQVVISGTRAALDAAAEPLQAAGARRVIPLKVSGPFHSPMMRGAGAALADEFESASWNDADPPVVSNVTGEPVSAAAEIRALLARQVSSPVEWVRSVRAMHAAGADTFIELGPGTALAGMVRRIAPRARTLSVADEASLFATVEALAQPMEASVRP
jgi:[acyl-carrier-protein] S-malonyltransferase